MGPIKSIDKRLKNPARWTKTHWVLDLGTKHFTLFGFGDLGPQIFQVPSQGMKRSTVVNKSLASAQIENLFALAQEGKDLKIKKVAVVLSAQNTDSFRSKMSLNIKDQLIDAKVMARFKLKMEQENARLGKELLEQQALLFQIDQREPTTNPLGFTGRMLHGESLLIFADSSYLADIIDLCNQNSCKVEGFIPDFLALNHLIQRPKAEKMGYAICDIGAGTCKGLIIKDGTIMSLFKIPMGGDSWTQDLSIGLALSQEEAEKVKLSYGMAESLGRHTLTVRSNDGKSQEVIGRNVEKITRARSLEFSSLLSRELMEFKGLIPGGICLTGGGSQLLGLADYLNARLRVPVAVWKPGRTNTGNQIPAQVTGSSHLIDFYRPERATVIGGAALFCEKIAEQGQQTLIGKSFSQLGRWITELGS